MDKQEELFATAVDRLSALGRKDREAVLAKMSPEDRTQFESALRQRAEELRKEEERQRRIDRQFLAYSPWLATLLEQAEDNSTDSLTATCAKAVWQVHTAKVSAGMAVTRTGWLGVVDRFNDWLAPSGKGNA